MAYTKQTWSDGKAGATPINAARLQYMESGIFGATTATGLKSDRVALATASLPVWFQFFETDTGYLRVWDGVAWRYLGRPGGDNPWAGVSSNADVAVPNAGEFTGSPVVQEGNTDTAMFTFVAGTGTGAGQGAAVRINEDGRYRVDAEVGFYYATAATNYYCVAQFRLWGAGTVAPVKPSLAYEIQSMTMSDYAYNSQYTDVNLSGEAWLTAGSTVALFTNGSPVAGLVVRNGCRWTVQRVG